MSEAACHLDAIKIVLHCFLLRLAKQTGPRFLPDLHQDAVAALDQAALQSLPNKDRVKELVTIMLASVEADLQRPRAGRAN